MLYQVSYQYDCNGTEKYQELLNRAPYLKVSCNNVTIERKNEKDRGDIVHIKYKIKQTLPNQVPRIIKSDNIKALKTPRKVSFICKLFGFRPVEVVIMGYLLDAHTLFFLIICQIYKRKFPNLK